MRVSSPFKSSPRKVTQPRVVEDCFGSLPETPQNPPPARKRFSPIKTTRTSKKKPPLYPPTPATNPLVSRSRKSSSSYHKPLLNQQRSRTASSSTTHYHSIHLPESLSFTQQRQRTLCAEDEAGNGEQEETEGEPSPCVEIASRKATAKKFGLASRVRRRLQFATAASAVSTTRGWVSPKKDKQKKDSSLRKGFQRLGTADGSPEDVFRDYRCQEGEELVCGS
ncbi:uncharacterized protein BP01DRAFT_392063 [Aspergillus saccharolyticus JOP 1030-1]|uniref:Uncharacterized protein n=1 Tax=Aspergillus saccharolyticus JOP 1030-1 TaxID=1450539 RepID=A0A318ZEM3_9EURO|nr:hypothetical protein BP01DRAFT_392063 [Aspergillus saccharolyticus JOP 1030-1]PYH45117.1 hypothetical protein BP01DRAFT_392063 [Aspergillus saccharolyticus JOP 1030-1]